ncbi:unnamed protein product, partial [Protopolystoma xenopodis]
MLWPLFLSQFRRLYYAPGKLERIPGRRHHYRLLYPASNLVQNSLSRTQANNHIHAQPQTHTLHSQQQKHCHNPSQLSQSISNSFTGSNSASSQHSSASFALNSSTVPNTPPLLKSPPPSSFSSSSPISSVLSCSSFCSPSSFHSSPSPSSPFSSTLSPYFPSMSFSTAASTSTFSSPSSNELDLSFLSNKSDAIRPSAQAEDDIDCTRQNICKSGRFDSLKPRQQRQQKHQQLTSSNNTNLPQSLGLPVSQNLSRFEHSDSSERTQPSSFTLRDPASLNLTQSGRNCEEIRVGQLAEFDHKQDSFYCEDDSPLILSSSRGHTLSPKSHPYTRQPHPLLRSRHQTLQAKIDHPVCSQPLSMGEQLQSKPSYTGLVQSSIVETNVSKIFSPACTKHPRTNSSYDMHRGITQIPQSSAHAYTSKIVSTCRSTNSTFEAVKL